MVIVIVGVLILGSFFIFRLFSVVKLVMVISRFKIIISIGWCMDNEGKLFVIGVLFIVKVSG